MAEGEKKADPNHGPVFLHGEASELSHIHAGGDFTDLARNLSAMRISPEPQSRMGPINT